MSAIETPAEHAPETHFKRVLGLPSLVLFGLAYMVPLTVWTTYGVVTTKTEGFLPAAYVVTTVAMLFTAYSYGRMVVAHPVAGLHVRLARVRALAGLHGGLGAAPRLRLPADDQLPR